MRTVVEILAVVALVVFAWDKSYRERLSDIPIVGERIGGHSTSPSRATHRAAQSENGAWMWDPNRKTSLDRPAYNADHSFTGHVYYVDANGARYWIDTQGQRHYDP